MNSNNKLLITNRASFIWLLKAILLLLFISTFFNSCVKMIEIDPPASTITNEQAFSDSSNAVSSILGLYSKLGNRNNGLFSSGNLTIALGLYSDEVNQIGTGGYFAFLSGQINQRDGTVTSLFWDHTYSIIYHCNISLEQLMQSKALSIENRRILAGEAKFIRALCYFYLVNFFDGVPIIVASNYHDNISLARNSREEVYSQIITDLKSAQQALPENYTFTKNERIRATKFAATALLARTYLYSGDWEESEKQATSIINASDIFSLSTEPKHAFDVNSTEAILQLHIDNKISPYNLTGEGFRCIPNPGAPPTYFFQKKTIQSFEPNDRRRREWIDSSEYLASYYHFPFKYTIGERNGAPLGTVPQYYTLLRTAEQFLIRAEARVHQNNYTGASEDLNILRSRAGLNDIKFNDLDNALKFIVNERRHELIAEMGHRWFDIRRLGLADEVNKTIKPSWESYKQTLPIPFTELQKNSKLIQNPGY